MIFHKWTRLFLLVPLLLSAIQLTPAQALTTNSVIWCPSAVTVPTSNRNGCSPLFPTMALLLTHLDTKDPAVAVTIWMGRDYNSATAGDGNIVIDGTTFVRTLKYPLTIKGGWNGPGKGTLNLQSPSTLDAATLAVVNWKGKVTLKNIHVMLRSTAGTSCRGGTAAVCVQTKGSIQLDRVHEERIGSPVEQGALLDNTTSMSSPPGSVIVTNSSFLKNIYGGLTVLSSGTVTLTNIYAEGNVTSGTFVDNTTGFAPVILKGTNSFLGNGNDGLSILSKGNVTAQRLVAYQNASSGVYINNTSAPSAKGVTITGSGKFMGNAAGLYVSSRGNVSLNGVIAASNTYQGFLVRADGNITLTCSDAYGNGTGLYVISSDGAGPALKLTLKGVLNYGNTTPEDIPPATPVIRTTCPTQ